MSEDQAQIKEAKYPHNSHPQNNEIFSTIPRVIFTRLEDLVMASRVLDSCYSFQSFEDDFPAFAGVGRPSNVLNEDDYDYAIELKPDNEYRLTAEALPDTIDFNEELNFPIEDYEPEQKDDDSLRSFSSHSNSPQSMQFVDDEIIPPAAATRRRSSLVTPQQSPIDHQSTADFSPINTTLPSSPVEEESSFKKYMLLKKSDFLQHMKLLQQRQRWVETLSKRSSLDFIRHHQFDSRSMMDRFILLIAKGVVVRRHQAGKYAEYVKLSSIDGCKTITWETEDVTRKRKKDKTRRQSRHVTATYERGTLDCCILLCGCGDDVSAGIDHRCQQEPTIRSLPSRVESRMNLFHNYGYRRRGALKDKDIIAVHPSLHEDPTKPGASATHTFRNSKDEYNAAMSFSIITTAVTGLVNTLDVECEDEDDYFVLLGGFLLLCDQVAKATAERKTSPRPWHLEQMTSNISEVWKKSQTIIRPKQDDPIAELFHTPSLNPQSTDKKLVPPAQFLGWKSPGTQIWARLRMAGLDVKCQFSWDLQRVILKLRCPVWRLEEVAEKMHMRLRTRTGVFKRFKITRRDQFATNGHDSSIFRSADRQRIIDFIIRSKIRDGGAELDEDTPLGSCIQQRFPLHMTSRLIDLRHVWITFWKTGRPGEVPAGWSPFSVPLSVTVSKCYHGLSVFWNGLLSQPLDEVAEYYGEGIAFYFAWVAFFTRWLFFPSFFGIIVFCVQVSARRIDHWICIPYAIFIMIWACFMLVFWRQKSSALAYRWGVFDFEMEETERPQFKGKPMLDRSTGEVRKVYSPFRRLLKYMVSFPIMIAFLAVMIFAMMILTASQDNLAEQYENEEKLDYTPDPNILRGFNSTRSGTEQYLFGDKRLHDMDYWMATIYYPSLYGLFLHTVAELFQRVAFLLNDFENHRTQSTYWNRLILKIFSFRFVSVFTPIYYYAFFYGNSEVSMLNRMEPVNAMQESFIRMSVSILCLMTVGDWWSKFLDIFIPSVLQRVQLYRMKTSLSQVNKKIWMARIHGTGGSKGQKMVSRREKYLDQSRSQCWEEALKKDYTTFGDYTQVVIQLGFVLLFGAIFPLAPVIALVNNLVFIRLDASKLTYTRKRPIAQKVGGLGVWEDVLQIMSVVGILTNCCLMGITSSQLSRILYFISPAGVAIILFAYEHIMLFFKYILHTSIPSVSPAVQRDQERKKSLTRKLHHRKPDRNSKQPPPQKRDRPSMRSLQSFSQAPATPKHQSVRHDVGESSFDAYLTEVYAPPKVELPSRQQRTFKPHMPSFEEYEDEPLDAINLQSLMNIKRKSIKTAALLATAANVEMECEEEIESVSSSSEETESAPNDASSSSSSDCCRSVKSARGYSLRLSRGPGPAHAPPTSPVPAETKHQMCAWDTPYDNSDYEEASPTLTAASLRELELTRLSRSTKSKQSRNSTLSPVSPLNLTPFSEDTAKSKTPSPQPTFKSKTPETEIDSPSNQNWSKVLFRTKNKRKSSVGGKKRVSVGKKLQLGPPKHSPAVKRASPKQDKQSENITPNRPLKRTVKKNPRPAKASPMESGTWGERSAAAYMAHLERYKSQRSASVVEVDTSDKKRKQKRSPALKSPVMVAPPKPPQDEKLKEFLKMWIRDHSNDEEDMANPFSQVIVDDSS